MILKTKIDPMSWPFLGLKQPFHGDFNGIFAVQIDPKMAEKARCQFAWPLLWPSLSRPFYPSAIYYQLYTTAKKAFLLALVSFTPNYSQKRQNKYLLHFPPLAVLKT